MPQPFKPSRLLRDLAAALDTQVQSIPDPDSPRYAAPETLQTLRQTASVGRLAAELVETAASALAHDDDAAAHRKVAETAAGSIEYVAEALSALGSAAHQLIQLPAPTSSHEVTAELARTVGELNFGYARAELRDAADNLRAVAQEVEATSPARDSVALRRSGPATVQPTTGPTTPPAPANPTRPSRGRP
ncbi:hypothetical protein V2S66_16850 [Streptomyces sp. V4-01]|uniref:Uncharacterized protein n=1 Tax=Actinacidiphila polyblastidii TaxID=3110430 RepID=A0ABU7PCV6_9ACTN|nr:hypothetical protein [Streptomyces sp. V4-01]